MLNKSFIYYKKKNSFGWTDLGNFHKNFFFATIKKILQLCKKFYLSEAIQDTFIFFNFSRNNKKNFLTTVEKTFLWESFVIICNYLSESLLESLLESSSESSSESGSDSDSESGSALINLDICILFILYLHSSK